MFRNDLWIIKLVVVMISGCTLAVVCLELTGGSWRLYSVSLLYNLQRMIDSVQLYSRSLTAHTKAGMGKGEQAVFAGETEEGDEDSGGMETVAKAVITVMTGIKSFVSDQSAIRITVNGKKSTGECQQCVVD